MKAIRLHHQHSTLVVQTVLPTVPIDGPTVDLSSLTQPRLEATLAVVLAARVPLNALPGDVARAVTGVFLAVNILDTTAENFTPSTGTVGGGFLLGEQLLPLLSVGELRLHLDGELVATTSVTRLGDPVTRLTWLAGEGDDLHAGDAVLLDSPENTVPAASGTLLLEGPTGAMLTANLRGVA